MLLVGLRPPSGGPAREDMEADEQVCDGDDKEEEEHEQEEEKEEEQQRGG